VAPSWIVGVSAYVSPPLHHKVQEFSSGEVLALAYPGGPGKKPEKSRKMVVVVVLAQNCNDVI